jgi:hypothetical protein
MATTFVCTFSGAVDLKQGERAPNASSDMAQLWEFSSIGHIQQDALSADVTTSICAGNVSLFEPDIKKRPTGPSTALISGSIAFRSTPANEMTLRISTHTFQMLVVYPISLN